VQTIHNFRISCLKATFSRNNEICEECKDKIPWRGILRKCYKDSLAASTALAATLTIHKSIGTYKNKVTAYIALNEFCRSKLIEMGLPENRIHVKPNFVDQSGSQDTKKTGNPLYVGRFSKEKGVVVLAEAIKSIPEQQFDVVGDGEEKHLLEKIPNVNLLGSLNHSDIIKLMLNAPFFIIPSLWYENMPRTIVEAFSCGTPVIASDIGALSTMVDHGETGLLFRAGSVKELESSIRWSLNNEDDIQQMGNRAKDKYSLNYTEEINYRILMEVYDKAINSVQ
jgi:glycosyltransferase involved in cell wall biosynthesis